MHDNRVTPLLRLLLPAASLLICDCLFSAQSGNHGRLLDPGVSQWTTGFGWRPYEIVTRDYGTPDPASYVDTWTYDTTSYGWFNLGIDYRLGILDKRPFGAGFEFGLHLEALTRTEHYYDDSARKDRSQLMMYGPPVLEFSGRFGLPDATLSRSVFHHNIGLGWMVGAWVDDGWLAEYAAGWEFLHLMPYCGARVFLTATDIFRTERQMDDDFFTNHDQIFNVRLQGGVGIKLPPNIPVVPDIIEPEVSFFFPNYSPRYPVGFGFSLGLRWMNGN